MILFTGGGAIANHFSQNYPCQIISARKLSDEELTKWILQADVIIHNAAVINASSISEYIVGNFLLTKRIIDLVVNIKPSIKFINISSMSILANSHEYAAIDQMSDYAYSKFIAEQYCIRKNLPRLTNIRFSTIFYGDEKRDGISKLIYDCITKNEVTIYNDGSAYRDIIPINILCEYLYKLTILANFDNKINIVSGNKTQFRILVEILQKQKSNFKINNIEANFNVVLSDFSKESILKIGEIPFQLEDEILNYFRKVNAISHI